MSVLDFEAAKRVLEEAGKVESEFARAERLIDAGLADQAISVVNAICRLYTISTTDRHSFISKQLERIKKKDGHSRSTLNAAIGKKIDA